MSKVCVFTVCTEAQYPYTRILADSLPTDIIFEVGIIDGNLANTTPLAEVVKLTIFQQDYDQSNLLAASKSYFASYFLDKTECDIIVYCDPTIQFFDNLNFIIQQLSQTDIVLTLRITKPFGQSFYGDEKLFLASGMYDAGFWGIRKSEESKKFLAWWQQMVADKAKLDICNGMNHDQLWLNFVPIFFKNVGVVKNIGWNLGAYNLHERTLTYSGGKWWVNEITPLIFINFRELILPQLYKNNKLFGVEPLVKQYQQQLTKYNANTPDIFSFFAHKNPIISSFRKTIRKQITSVITYIYTYPLYHKR